MWIRVPRTGRKELTNRERQAVWETLLLKSKDGKLSHGQIAEIACDLQVRRRTVERIWKRGRETMSVRIAAMVKSRGYLRGRKREDRRPICGKLRELAVEDRTNQLKLVVAANTSNYMIGQLIKEGYMKRALKQTRPLLTDEHKIERLKFCVSHVVRLADLTYVFDSMYDVVHIDEKWFYVKKLGQKVYIMTDLDGRPLETPPVQFVQHKSHIVKVMFLVAVARPRGDWDGKIGIWPITEDYVTKRTSKNRPAGITIQQAVSIDRPRSRQLLVNEVIPAIQAKWPQHEKGTPIRIQQDNASPHVLEDDPDVRAAGLSNGWNIQIATKRSWRAQPAQSPDLNILDLGFFNSIQSLQSRTRPRTMEDLIDEVKLAFDLTERVTLDKTFVTLQFIMIHIMRSKGCNDFRLGHLKKDFLLRHEGSLPTALPCDDETYKNALSTIFASGEPMPSDGELQPAPPPRVDLGDYDMLT